ncbi:hypothetical protein HY612_03745 [Candidatus Roizmanbacteria bacterium]|nr:hypothetical protein [Candidatus Roizmanbacteria bacterium]
MKRSVNPNLLSLGVYYFVLARSAAFFGFNPNSGNLYHLSLELLLKSVLSKKYSNDELRCRYKHKLKKMWKDFKSQNSIDDVSELDEIVKILDKFELIRYLEFPNRKSLALTVDFGAYKSWVKASKGHETDPYSFNFDDMDKLFKFIILKSSMNPNFIKSYFIKKEAKEMYERENKHSIFSKIN